MLTSIATFLERFKLPQSKSKRFLAKEVAAIVSAALGKEVPAESFRVQQKIAYMNVSPVVRSEILLRREHIVAALRDRTEGAVGDIK